MTAAWASRRPKRRVRRSVGLGLGWNGLGWIAFGLDWVGIGSVGMGWVWIGFGLGFGCSILVARFCLLWLGSVSVLRLLWLF